MTATPLPAARFVDDFFRRVLFQPDDAIARAALSGDLDPDAQIVINGARMSAQDFTDFMLQTFRAGVRGKVVHILDLDVVAHDARGRTGIVAQTTKYTTTRKNDGTITKSSATTIVQVIERDGRQMLSSFWEAQTDEK